jgi:hypothetical protein
MGHIIKRSQSVLSQKPSFLLSLFFLAEFVLPMKALIKADHVGGRWPPAELYNELERGVLPRCAARIDAGVGINKNAGATLGRCAEDRNPGEPRV